MLFSSGLNANLIYYYISLSINIKVSNTSIEANKMRQKKENLAVQRQILEQKLKPWRSVFQEQPPPIGWIKAVRGALGMTMQQLANRMGIAAASVSNLEQREADEKITLELLNRAAKAIHCKVVYAVVPSDGYNSLEAILDDRAEMAAKKMLKRVSHSMHLEAQETTVEDRNTQLLRLARELKETLDSRLWDAK